MRTGQAGAAYDQPPVDGAGQETRRHAHTSMGGSTDHPTGEGSRGQVERAIPTVRWLVSG